jgi:N-methylhydantoinase B
MLRTSRSSAPREGLMGGRAGSASLTTLTRDGVTEELPLQTHLHLDVRAGDVMHHVIGGTAGYGDPFARDPQAVLQDVRDQKLSPEAARAQYGVALDAAGGLDAAATATLREA